MTAEIHNFYSHWKKKQETLRKSLGYAADLWYTMLDNGYEPTNEEDVEKFIEDMMDNE
tara:strand:+ start:141 stop:314 length:174 start_codon:yes stop_codon:yes gene_type:complete